jgi:ATP-dependent Clp protease ATP-binding subunit ClpC
VGKTYLTKRLAVELFGSEDALIRVDMSEYMEKHTVSRMVGAPPGYVGYEEGGQLTDRVRRKPYSIVLLDEIEKAHSDIFNVLLQVMDEGRLTDGNGTTVDFRNTVIIMTSNTGTRQLKEFGQGMGFTRSDIADPEYARGIIRKTLQKQFSPEFLNRLDDIIFFDQLTKESLYKIVDIEMRPLQKRIREMGYDIQLTDSAREWLGTKGYDVQFGARPLKRLLQTAVEDPFCQLILDGSVHEGQTICVDAASGDAKELSFK